MIPAMLAVVRFYRVMPLHSPYLLVCFGLAAVAGTLRLFWDPDAAVSALVPVLMLQMFGAASGFDVPARRGHFDLLLTGGTSRVAVAIGHFAASVLPGVAVWFAVGAVEALANGAHRALAFTSGSLLALFVVSLVAWSITVPLPRLAGGVIWLLLTAVAVAPVSDIRARLPFPFHLVGSRIERAGGEPATVACALVLWCLAVAWIAREDIPLETAQ